MLKTIIAFLFVLSYGLDAFCDDKEFITLVRKSNGMLTFKVSFKTEGKVKVDWGSNNIQVYDVIATNRFNDATVIAEEVKRNVEIKIYGNGITLFSCVDQFVTQLNLVKAPNLTHLNCSKNYINTLDLSKNKNLRNFNASENRLKDLDVSKNNKITNIYCSYNYLKSISLDQNLNLQHLSIADNLIRKIDLTENKSLNYLNLNGNKFTALDLNAQKKLNYLDLSYNKFSACEFNKIFKIIPRVDTSERKNLIINFNKGANKSNTLLAENKNWNLDIKGKGSAKCDY